MTYPATTYAEGVELTITSGNQLHEIINGDATEEINTESGMVPSVRKALADAMLFKPAIAWAQGSVESDPFQTRLYGEGIYWAPAASNETPISMGENPNTDGNWFLAPVTGGESITSNTNLLNNHNFLTSSPDSITQPSTTPTDYVSGTQVFSGIFVGEDIIGLTYINGRVSWASGTLYFSVPNTGGLEYVDDSDFVASVADFDGKPRTRGVSFSLVGDEYRVTVGIDALEDESANITPLGSVKFEQGSVATKHEVVDNLFYKYNEIRGVFDVEKDLVISGTLTIIDGRIRPSIGVVVTIASDCKVISNCDWRDESLGGTFNFQAGSFEKRMPDKVSSPTGGYIVNWGYPGNSIDESSGTSFVFGGTQSLPHTLGPQCQLSGILNGYDNHIVSNAISSLICGGAHNYIKDGGNHGTVVGGAFNDVYAPFSFIGGGELNKNRATWSHIGGGQKNETGEDGVTPIDVRSSFVGCGDSNKAKSLLSTISGGDHNETSGDWAAIAGGRNNLASGENSTASGNNNTASGDSSLAVGTSNDASGLASSALCSSNKATANYSSAWGFFNEANGSGSSACGQYSISHLKGQQSSGSPAFAVKGSSQKSELVAAALTVGSQTKTMHLGIEGVDNITIPNNTSWMFKVSLIARNIDTDGENGAWVIEGAIKKDATNASTSLIGTTNKTVIDSPAGWDNGGAPSVSANTSIGAMDITVSTGVSVSDSIRWVARIDLVQVSG